MENHGESLPAAFVAPGKEIREGEPFSGEEVKINNVIEIDQDPAHETAGRLWNGTRIRIDCRRQNCGCGDMDRGFHCRLVSPLITSYYLVS